MLLVIAAVVGVVWHFARPAILVPLAKGSLGNYARGDLIESALQQRLGISPRDPTREPAWMGVESCAEGSMMERIAGVTPDWWQISFFDRELRRICECRTVGRYLSELGDRDGDGRMEMETWSYRENPSPMPSERGIEIVRATERGVEWVGTVAIDVRTLMGGPMRVVTRWNDVHRDGPAELIIAKGGYQTLCSGEHVELPSKTLAILKWDHPGGVLVPVEVAAGAGVRVIVPEGRPKLLPPDGLRDEGWDAIVLPPPPQAQPSSAPASTFAPATVPTSATSGPP